MDKTRIEQQAKKIMDGFLEALGEVEHLPYEVGGERRLYVREECIEEKKEEKIKLGIKKAPEKEFAELMLKNAPKTKDNCIVAEKKKW